MDVFLTDCCTDIIVLSTRIALWCAEILVVMSSYEHWRQAPVRPGVNNLDLVYAKVLRVTFLIANSSVISCWILFILFWHGSLALTAVEQFRLAKFWVHCPEQILSFGSLSSFRREAKMLLAELFSLKVDISTWTQNVKNNYCITTNEIKLRFLSLKHNFT